MDEKGFQQGCIGKVKVMINKYEKKQYMSQPGNREWVSLIECISTDGRALPPWIIFKAKNYKKNWIDALDGTPGYVTISDNGWTNNEIGLLWLQRCFTPHTENQSTRDGEYRLLCLDGHASHISTHVIEYALQERIILLCLPPHSTHILQPLDINVFGPLAVNYKNIILRKSDYARHYSISKEKFIECYLEARNLTYTEHIILGAWRKVGLLPYNPDLILQGYPDLMGGSESQNNDIILTYRPTTPPEVTISYPSSEGIQTSLLTPKNTYEIQRIVNEFGQTADPMVCQAFNKVGKTAIQSLSSLLIERRANNRLLELQEESRQKTKRSKIKTDGEAIVLT